MSDSASRRFRRFPPAAAAWCALAALLPSPAAHGGTVIAGATWNDNATNADAPGDRIGALRLETGAAWQRSHPLARNLTLIAGLRIDAEAWPRFDGLDRIAAGPTVELRRKFGLGALAPIVALAAEASLSAARESGRAGPAGTLALVYRQRFSAHQQLQLSAEVARHDARAAVFDRDGVELSARFAHDLTDVWRLALTARWRTGTVLAYATPPRPDLVALERTRTPSDTFERPFMAYSLEADTGALAAAASRALGENASINLAVEWRETERHSIRYRNRLVSLAWVHQF